MAAEDPQVYIATYLNTEVYESLINEQPIMRRCKDDWVNATQILKCCNFPKAKRTKILEKGVQRGLHQKIQGGYGRFQGTWIPLPDAQKLATSYGVTPEVAPILFFDAANPGFELLAKSNPVNKDGTPIKRKYVKRKKPEGSPPKKLKGNNGEFDFHRMGYNGNVSNNANANMGQNLVQQNVFYEYPYQPMNNNVNNMNFNNVNNVNSMNNNVNNVGVPMNNMMMNNMNMNQNNMPVSHGNGIAQSVNNQNGNQDMYQMQMMNMNYNYMNFKHSKLPSSQSTNETNWSQEDTKESDTSMSSNEEKRPKESYSALLLKFFSEETQPIPYFIHNPPYDFNINAAIDDEGHTPLHWAASIGNYVMIHLLISKGANPLVVNNYGLNPLSKLISFNNCYELKNFPKVLDDLEICLINTDINGRTPLHYLCQFSKVPSKYESLRYYLGVILGKLTTMTNQSGGQKNINLLKNVLDHQDVNGDTCLHLAVKAGCAKLVKYLLGYNARDDLYNVNQETAKYLIMRDDLLISKSPEIKVSTPVQPKVHRLETPDTQRTTIQDDDEDEIQARVDKEQLNQLLKNSDNKENAFLDSMKSFEMSTPIQAGKSDSFSQPLAVISERTAESTPMIEMLTETSSKYIKPEPVDTPPQTCNIRPPKINSEGEIVDRKAKDTSDELSAMLTSFVKVYTDSHKETMKKLDAEVVQIQGQIKQKESKSEKLMYDTTYSLAKIGVEDFVDLEKAHESVDKFYKEHEDTVQKYEGSLINKLEKSQAFNLAKLVSREEENVKDEPQDANKFELAVELMQLQVQRSSLLASLVKNIKFYGVDTHMYKYRKLISLSCGLNIDEIDSLIDGIEELLMETKT